MKKEHLIPIEVFCQCHEVELAFVRGLHEHGLIEITTVESGQFIAQEKLPDLEKMMRLHFDLDINFAGIDTIFHLMQKMEAMQRRMRRLEERLRLYEG